MKRITISSTALATALMISGCSPSAEKSAEGNVSSGAQTEDFNIEKNAYFGDLHVHTGLSFDAYIFNVRATPEDAYRFALGETIKHPFGQDLQLKGPPLDFMAVTDHASYMGVLREMGEEGNPLAKLELSKRMNSSDPSKAYAAFNEIGNSLYGRKYLDELRDPGPRSRAWKEVVDTANRYNKPGKFTAFIGYEWTSSNVIAEQPKGRDIARSGNLHRNVIYRGNKAAELPFSSMDSNNAERLWAWMDAERDAGRDILAIPHNSNVSNGYMFDDAQFDGSPMTATYAETRMRNEPLVEITQVKGTSETDPSLAPNDEWANFENYSILIGLNVKGKIDPGNYVRSAYIRGMEMQDKDGFNPYKFGIIGSSDTHLGGSTQIEERHNGKVGVIDGLDKLRGGVPADGGKNWADYNDDQEETREARYSRWSAAGLAGVWAEENTREAIFDAMRRKETFGTSGTRIKIRFFAGKDIDDSLLTDKDRVKKAYANGVAMGGKLEGDTPNFLLWAQQDPLSAPLQRIQIVKGWMENGTSKEQVFDVACSDGFTPDPTTHRCGDNGAKVNLSDCSFSKDKGSPELISVWKDPLFKQDQSAFYYVRVLENPICRWSTWDANRAGVARNPNIPATVQERAWSSPIWYHPKQQG